MTNQNIHFIYNNKIMTTENLIISLVFFILFLIFIVIPMIFGLAKMMIQMKMKNQLWNLFSSSINNLSSIATGNHPSNSIEHYQETSNKSADNVNLLNLFLFLMLLVFATLMYLNSNRGSPKHSDTDIGQEEYFEYKQLRERLFQKHHVIDT